MEMINVGYIAGFHGLKGEMKIKTTTDYVEERFGVGSELYLLLKKEQIKVKIRSYRFHKGMPLIAFEDYYSLDDVEKFKGCALKIHKDMLFDLEEDEYYHFELIGAEVYDYNNELVGNIKSIMDSPANDIFVLETKGKDVLVPFVKSFVEEVDLNNKKIYLKEVEGLF
jgi:16S rRNA processing protein RimM